MPVDFLFPLLLLAVPALLVISIVGALRRRKRIVLVALLVEIGLLVVYVAVYVAPIWPIESKAVAGDAKCQFILGMHYTSRFGYHWPDGDKACFWLTKAAENGHPEAMFFIGIAHSVGNNSLNLPLDLRKARYWLSKALVNGVEEARSRLAEIEAQIALSERATTQP